MSAEELVQHEGQTEVSLQVWRQPGLLPVRNDADLASPSVQDRFMQPAQLCVGKHLTGWHCQPGHSSVAQSFCG